MKMFIGVGTKKHFNCFQLSYVQLILLFTAAISIFNILNISLQNDLNKQINLITSKIAIVIVIRSETDIKEYDLALQTLRCYSQIHSYDLRIVFDSDYDCNQKDKFFRRHCVVANLLPIYEALMFLDADVGVVNPNRTIEEFLSPGIDIVFYDRFYNWEIAAGSYIIRNTQFSRNFLTEFANYGSKLPRGYHGTDNGGLHMLLADMLLRNATIERDLCRRVYNNSKKKVDLFTFEACIRSLFGVATDFGNVRIMRKATGWVRDDFITGGQWHPDIDFMLHGWKTKRLKNAPKFREKVKKMSFFAWYNPLAGNIDLKKCHSRNRTWSYNTNLMGNKTEILEYLDKYRREVGIDQLKSISRISTLLENKKKKES